MDPVEKKKLEKHFSTIESSFRVEGMDPSGDEVYEAAKARILDGTMTAEQALAYVVEETRKLHQREMVSL